MSLKAFHVVFIAVSTVLCLGFGAWAIREYMARGGTGLLLGGIGALIAAVGLVLYGRWFLNKLKGESYL